MRKANMLFVVVSVFLLAAAYVSADANYPTGPTNIVLGESTHLVPYSSKQVNAIAGNVTEMNITATSQTQSWAGYFGQIRGTITLDDARNNTMYNWTLAEPRGEIYASNRSAVTWSNIKCYNYTNPTVSITDLEATFGILPHDVDGINETFFEATSHDRFYVGHRRIENNTCPAVHLFQNDTDTVAANFQNVLLTDDVAIIFTTLIERRDRSHGDIYGFDSRKHDFQLIVAEDGHRGDTSRTPYYFFVEIE